MKKTKFFKKRNILFGLFGVGILATPLVLTSCSETKKLIEKTIMKNDGSKFSSTLSLTQGVTNALKNNTSSQKGLLDTVVSELAWQWFNTDIAKDDKSLLDELSRHNRTTKEDYDELVKKYKKEKKDNWELLLQQDELDKSGGTEQTLKKNKHLEWATSQLKTKVFNNDFSSVIKKSDKTAIFKPSKEEIIQGLESMSTTNKDASNDYELGFSEKIIQNYSNADVEYAKFQKFIFDKWVEIENPFVINMSLWKYSTPSQTGGISAYYNTPKQESSGDGNNNNGSTGGDSSSGGSSSTQNAKLFSSTKEGESNNDGSSSGGNSSGGNGGDSSGGSGGDSGSTTTSSSGSYIYPYFSDEKNNTNTNTVGIFKQFLEGAKSNNNFKINGSSSSLGLKYIPKKYTEDSSTFILAKNSSIFNDLYIEFAAASSYLYGTTPNNGQKLVTEKKVSKEVNLTTPSALGFDPITNLFVSESTIKSGDASDINETKLSKDLLSKIINPIGPIAKVAEKDLHIIDAFKFKNTELNEYMLLRDEAGVHAISIDGSDYIKTGTNKKEVAKKAGDVVLYHSLMNKYYGKDDAGNAVDDVLNVDLKSELNKFFESNMSYLVLEYAKDNTNQKMFNLEEALNKESSPIQQTLITSLNTYLFELSKYNIQKDYVKKMYDAKSKYSANYGIETQKNGLDACVVFNE